MPDRVFAIDAAGEPVAHQLPGEEGTSPNGHRVDTGELPGLTDALLDLVGVAHVEVYDGSGFRQV